MIRVIRAICLWPAVTVALLLVTACQRSTVTTTPQITLVATGGREGPVHDVLVSPLSSVDVRAAQSLKTPEEWQRVLRVSVKGASTAIAGRYAARNAAIVFTPFFPFDPGREYVVSFDRSALSGASDAPMVTTVTLAAGPPVPPTFVTQVYPSGDTIPENQLRFYIHFSAPMGRGSGLDHVRLLDDRGAEVTDPFLPVDADLWNSSRTRYTVFFDPGRQKRGILPNREMGRSLVAGRTYTLAIDREWIDGYSHPLREAYTRQFRVVPADLSPVNYAQWKITAPAAGTRDPVSVRFPEPLDHGLLLRAIGVKRDGQAVSGEVTVEDHERLWILTPSTPWTAGRYELVAMGILEDLAGNRIGRAFEIISTKGVDEASEQTVTTIPFTVQ